MPRRKGAVVNRKLGFAATAGALAVALALTMSACGSSGDSEGVASLTETAGQTSDESSGADGSKPATREDREQAELDYARCMREHGVDFPDPVNGRFEFRATPGDEGKMEEAQEACGGILERLGPQKLDEAAEAKMQEAALEFARCMREHGVDMPDPEFREGGGLLQKAPKGAEGDPGFEEAKKACQPILEDARPDRDAPRGEDS
jgi:hypothetical protein